MRPVKCILLKLVFFIFVSLTATHNVNADSYTDEQYQNAPSAEAMVFDGLVVRPISLAGTIIGTGIFVATLPFTLFSDSTGKASERLISEPAEYTFKRCLGCLEKQKRTH